MPGVRGRLVPRDAIRKVQVGFHARSCYDWGRGAEGEAWGECPQRHWLGDHPSWDTSHPTLFVARLLPAVSEVGWAGTGSHRL